MENNLTKLRYDNTLDELVAIYNTNLDKLYEYIHSVGVNKLVETFVASENQTVFKITKGTFTRYSNSVMVFVGGSIQVVGEDYLETSEDTITMNKPVKEGTQVIIIYSDEKHVRTENDLDIEGIQEDILNLGNNLVNLKSNVANNTNNTKELSSQFSKEKENTESRFREVNSQLEHNAEKISVLNSASFVIDNNYYLSNNGTDWRPAFQKAIDDGYGEIIILNKTYPLSLDETTYAGKGTGIGLRVRSNLKITGLGTLKVMDGSGGQSGYVIANDVDGVENIDINDITIDGNKENTSGTIAAICLFGAKNCNFNRVKVKNMSYVGLMMRGDNSKFNNISNCIVEDVGYIGIQCNKNIGTSIVNNKVLNCGDNGIDVEWNSSDGTTNFANMNIEGNYVENVLNGIFIESVSGFTIKNNILINPRTNGIIFNRINSKAGKSKVEGNIIKTDESLTINGITFNNSCGECDIINNTIENTFNAINCNKGIDNLLITNNKFINIVNYYIKVAKLNNSLVYSHIDKNYVIHKDTCKTSYPINENPKDTRFYKVKIGDFIDIKSSSTLFTPFYTTKIKLLNTQPAWGGAYSLYYNGDTKICLGTINASVGDYLIINKITYIIKAISGVEYTIIDENSNSGNFTSVLNDSLEVLHYNSEAWDKLQTE